MSIRDEYLDSQRFNRYNNGATPEEKDIHRTAIILCKPLSAFLYSERQKERDISSP